MTPGNRKMTCERCGSDVESFETHGPGWLAHHCAESGLPPPEPETRYPGLREKHHARFAGQSDFMIERQLGEFHKISTDSLVSELRWRGYRVRLEA